MGATHPIYDVIVCAVFVSFTNVHVSLRTSCFDMRIVERNLILRVIERAGIFDMREQSVEALVVILCLRASLKPSRHLYCRLVR